MFNKTFITLLVEIAGIEINSFFFLSIVVYNFSPMFNKTFITLLVEIAGIEINSFFFLRNMVKCKKEVSKMLIFLNLTFDFNYLKMSGN